MKNLSEADILKRLLAKREDYKVTREEVINPDYEMWGRCREWYYHQGVCLLAELSPISKPYFDIIINQRSPFDLVHWTTHYPTEATDLTRLRNIHECLQQIPQVSNTRENGRTLPPKALINLCKDVLDINPNLIEIIKQFGPHSSLNLPNTFCALEIDPAKLENLKKFKEQKKPPLVLNFKEDSPSQALPYPPQPSEPPLSVAKRLFPLKGSGKWEKADVLSLHEIILLHYGIDPERIYETHLPREPIDDVHKEFIDYLSRYFFDDPQWFVRQLDENKLVDLLQRSIHAGSIQPSDQNVFLKAEIVEWMTSKCLAFPIRMESKEVPTKSKISKEDILNYDLKRLDKDQLAKLMTRCDAAALWKNHKSHTLQQIRKQPDFKKRLGSTQELIGKKEPFDEKTIEDWIRNLSPIYKPKK